MIIQIEKSSAWSTVFLSFLLLLGISTAGIAGEGDEGKAAGTFLKIDPSARSAGAGSAYVAKSSDPLSLYFNPAGLGTIRRKEGTFTNNDIFAGISYNYFSYVNPVESLNGGIGISATSLDFGDLRRTRVTTGFNRSDPITNLGSFGAEDMAISLGYGGRIVPSLSTGLSVKYIRKEISSFTDDAVAGDLGLQYRTPLPRLDFGLSIRNIFGEIKLDQESDPLPRVFEAGGHYGLPVRGGKDLINLSFDYGFSNDADYYTAFGAEYKLFNTVIVRAGYNGVQDAGDGFTYGLGVHYGPFKFDLASVPFGELGDQNRFSLAYAFGSKSALPPRTSVTDQSEYETDTSKQEQTEKAPKKIPVEPTIRKSVSDKERDKSWKKLLNEGKRAHLNGEYAKARTKFKSAVELKPSHVPTKIWLGMTYKNLDENQRVKKIMQKVLQLDPDNKWVKRNFPDLYNEFKESQKSVEELINAGKRDYLNDRYKKARTQFKRLIERKPENVTIRLWLGMSEYRLGNESEAKRHFRMVLEQDPDNAWIRENFPELE